MTPEAYARMRELWAEGVKARAIASELGYSESYVRKVACTHRSDFPARHVMHGAYIRELAVARVRSGRMTRVQAARAAGVAVSTVDGWLRREAS